ncbi:hypothetical protein BKA93DRAFT_727123 [Sparassis latifolia]
MLSRSPSLSPRDSLPYSNTSKQPPRRPSLWLTKRYFNILAVFALFLSVLFLLSFLIPSTKLRPWKNAYLSSGKYLGVYNPEDQESAAQDHTLDFYAEYYDGQIDVTLLVKSKLNDAHLGHYYTAHEDPLNPPLYSDYHQRELQLPQHNLSLPFPEGRHGKYFWVGNHARSSGWGNVMQELLLIHYLTYRSGRTLVFDNYTWNEDGSDYSDYNGKLIPSRIPLTALIQGPTVGAPYITEAGLPRSVKKEFWDQVCPSPVTMMNEDLRDKIEGGLSAKKMVDKWAEVLTATDEPCIQIPRHSWSIFDIYTFGDPNLLLDVWPEFSKSPILTEFGWSPLVERAFDVNRLVFAPFNRKAPYLTGAPFTTSAERYAPLPGLLALHIRRGDFKQHCHDLAEWRSSYTGYNSFPDLPDKFVVPTDPTTEARLPLYLQNCYPTIREIVQRVQEVRATPAGRGLMYIYIMTNGDTAWVDQLKRALRATGVWANIASSRDLVVNHEERYVKHAVDMLIGQRAQVFVGNGFSSMSGLIVMLRMANGLSADSNRFWQTVTETID